MEKRDGPATITVIVWDRPCEITVYRKSKALCVAVGEYMGERIETRATSERSAAAHWREAARYKGKVNQRHPLNYETRF